MPTECERSATSPATILANATDFKDNLTTLTGLNEDLTTQTMMEGDMSTSQTSTTSNGSSSCNGGRKTSITSPDPTAYVAKARVTRPTPPPPPYNPMQFVQIKPCNLYQTAQEQLKKAEEVKKIKEIRKEEPEDWQNNLDNWKSSRRKRVEHIIDRVVEVKKLELEEHDRTRRKSKTFSEMIEERGERSGGRGLNKLASLAVYAEDEANDLSDLGIGTSSASGKSSLSEDYDNNSVMSDNAAELDKAITNNTHNKPAIAESTTREYISSPGYETSSSTAPASSPDPCEYTYEGAIQDYKQRVSRAASGLTSVALNKLSISQQQNSKESTPERPFNKEAAYPPRRGSKIEDRLMGFEVQSPSEECVEKNKVDVPKIDISKRKEIFESHDSQNSEPKSQLIGGNNNNAVIQPRVILKDRFKVQETTGVLTEQPKKEVKRLSGDLTSIKERLQSLEQQQNLVNGANGASKSTANKLVDIPVPPLKERLSSLQNAVTKEEVRKPPVVLVDARQLEIMKNEEEKAQQTLKEIKQEQNLNNQAVKETTKVTEKVIISHSLTEQTNHDDMEEFDRDDSGIHTADDVELEEQRIQADLTKKEQELKLNAAIEALAKEEKQLSEAANVVNQIEAEFEELSLGSVASLPPLTNNSTASSATPITNEHMEYSVSSTNPKASSSTCSNNNDNFNRISSSNNSISPINGNGSSDNSCGSNTNLVKGLDFKTTSNLRRKPTNEMVHAKNLLKIFKETFQNDIELDELEVNEENETKNIKNEKKKTNQDADSVGLNVETQVFENSTFKPRELANETNTSQTHSPSVTANSMIPRSVTCLGKPPISPLSIRSSTKFLANAPPASPCLAHKSDSQFSINGRVEIFNSKTMSSSPNTNSMKPLTPIMTTKKTQLPYINAAQSNSVVLPATHHKQQLPQDTTTEHQKTTTVIESMLSTTAVDQTTKKNVDDNHEDEKVKQMKSMPSQQLTINEPQTKENEEKHNNEDVKQQQTEVVVCAPPITIINPDELPKPNTVKNLSSCFQQQQQKPLAPKPLPRTRIPHNTPPPSPLLPRRQIGYKIATEYLEEPKKLSSSVLTSEEEKKFSMISSSSTSSSTSTGCTIIENSRKVSNTSSSTLESCATPTLIKTNAQIHTQPHDKNTINDETGKSENYDWTAKSCDEQTNKVLGQEENITSQMPTNVPYKAPLQHFESPKCELFKTSTPLVVSTLYDKYQPTPLPTSNMRVPLAPIKPTTSPSTTPLVITPAELPALPDCPPNESTLYKLASSAPPSPKTLGSLNAEKNLAIDSAICSSLLTSLAVTPEVLQRQHTVEEDRCQKVDKNEISPFHKGSTGYKDISHTDIKLCDGTTSSYSTSTVPQLQASILQRQNTVEEQLCQKLDINTLPDGKQQAFTGFKCISPTEIRKCDNFCITGSTKSRSRPNSPIEQARAAHSKALIDTCEKIIAEERLTSTQLKSSLPSSPVGTPVMQRKSKIPKPISIPIASCCKATESLNEADLKSIPSKEDKNGAIARLHVVETQIKVTTTTPPNSPKVALNKTPPTATTPSPQPAKKAKNIFDFLKKNFGVGGRDAHKNESQSSETVQTEVKADASQDPKVLVLSEQELQALDSVKYDETHKFNNSKFYIPSSEMMENDEMTVPPPLPKTPAPVNIEITRKIITDEILEGDKTEKDLTKEIDDLLDDELNKLNYEIQELEKVGSSSSGSKQ